MNQLGDPVLLFLLQRKRTSALYTVYQLWKPVVDVTVKESDSTQFFSNGNRKGFRKDTREAVGVWMSEVLRSVFSFYMYSKEKGIFG